MNNAPFYPHTPFLRSPPSTEASFSSNAPLLPQYHPNWLLSETRLFRMWYRTTVSTLHLYHLIENICRHSSTFPSLELYLYL